ncbi:MAG: hypothetical protein GY859_36990 [Desulfobacterales bacterium]|nr:hypothetical protein [Desulfobacterales bacterium]
MAKRPITPTYILFYILFSPDAWRILAGIILSYFATPGLLRPELGKPGEIMLYIMVAAIGWTISGAPARWITKGLKKLILGKNAP